MVQPNSIIFNEIFYTSVHHWRFTGAAIVVAAVACVPHLNTACLRWIMCNHSTVRYMAPSNMGCVTTALGWSVGPTLTLLLVVVVRSLHREAVGKSAHSASNSVTLLSCDWVVHSSFKSWLLIVRHTLLSYNTGIWLVYTEIHLGKLLAYLYHSNWSPRPWSPHL